MTIHKPTTAMKLFKLKADCEFYALDIDELDDLPLDDLPLDDEGQEETDDNEV